MIARQRALCLSHLRIGAASVPLTGRSCQIASKRAKNDTKNRSVQSPALNESARQDHQLSLRPENHYSRLQLHSQALRDRNYESILLTF